MNDSSVYANNNLMPMIELLEPAPVTVSMSHMRALLRAVEERGHDPAQFALSEGIAIAELPATGQFPAVEFGRLYQRAMWLLKDESLGMVSGGQVPSGTFRMVCLCLIHCTTLSSVVQRLGEFMEVCHGAAVKPSLHSTPDKAELRMVTLERDPETRLAEILGGDGPVRVRTTMHMWHNLLCWFAGRPLQLQSVSFNFKAPANGSEWHRLFGCEVAFEQANSALVYSDDMLKLANVQSEQSLQVFLKSVPYRLIVPAYQEQTLHDRVLALLGDDFTRPLPGAVDVAHRLGMSVSTMRRLLGAENTSFQALKDDCRRAAALRYLSSTDLTLSDIAGLLGFDESSAFFRAFKRWTGLTPGEYRRSAQTYSD